METSIVDLRYKTKDALKALENREKITILYHGKANGVILPIQETKKGSIKKHPFFGMFKDIEKSVENQMQKLRNGRYNAI